MSTAALHYYFLTVKLPHHAWYSRSTAIDRVFLMAPFTDIRRRIIVPPLRMAGRLRSCERGVSDFSKCSSKYVCTCGFSPKQKLKKMCHVYKCALCSKFILTCDIPTGQMSSLFYVGFKLANPVWYWTITGCSEFQIDFKRGSTQK
jgi:hypothetical protein